MTVTTASIRAARALNGALGQECVDWAIGLLQDGHDTPNLRILAGISPPLNPFEIAALRDRTLIELGFAPLDAGDPIRDFAAEILRDALHEESPMSAAIEQVCRLCVADGYRNDLYPFYLLHFAQLSLQDSEMQFYWDGATRANITAIIREEARAFATEAARS